MGQIITTGAEWDKALNVLKVLGLYDVYYDPIYMRAYLKHGEELEAYLYTHGNDLLFFPYIKSPIPGHLGTYDFQTVYGYGGPLSTTGDKTFLETAWLNFPNLAKGQGLIAGLVRFHPLLKTQDYSSANIFTLVHDRKTVLVDLHQDKETLKNEFTTLNKRMINKAEKNDVIVNLSNNADDFDTFINLYTRRMERLKAKDFYFFDYDYFEKLASLGPDTFQLYVARYRGQIIGGFIILRSERFVHYHLGASDDAFFKLGPNNILMYTAITDNLRSGKDYFHLGGGLTDAENDSLYEFKGRFSPLRADFYIGTCILDPDLYKQISQGWIEQNPDKVETFGKYVLKYRY